MLMLLNKEKIRLNLNAVKQTTERIKMAPLISFCFRKFYFLPLTFNMISKEYFVRMFYRFPKIIHNYSIGKTVNGIEIIENILKNIHP